MFVCTALQKGLKYQGLLSQKTLQLEDNYGTHEYFIIRLTENAFLCPCVCWQIFLVILGEDFRGSTGRIRLSTSVVQSAFAVLVTTNRKRNAEIRLSWEETAAASLAATEWLSSGFVSAAALLSNHSRWVWKHGCQRGWPSFVHSWSVWFERGREMCPTTGSVGFWVMLRLLLYLAIKNLNHVRNMIEPHPNGWSWSDLSRFSNLSRAYMTPFTLCHIKTIMNTINVFWTDH